MTANKPGTCTHGPNAIDGTRCGEPAVHWFTGADGTVYAECRAHSTAHIARQGTRTRDGHAVGDVVAVRRYGRTYTGEVSHVGARGAVYATFTYGNGASRTVRV